MTIYSILKTFKNGEIEKVHLLEIDNCGGFSNTAMIGSRLNNDDDVIFFNNMYTALDALSCAVDNGILKNFKILKKYIFSDE